ncbi:MAG: sodium:solute symporter [Ruminococcaceae bacterium]|nr:sodium:solute symporter [Oscillospiraceae bacterium]
MAQQTINVLVTLPFILLFFGLMIFVGIYCRKHATNVNGFVLGGRSVGPWLTAFAFGTSYFSAVIFVGYAGQFGWNFGLASTWIGLGNAFIGSLLAWVILGRRTRIMTQALGSRTMPDFFEKRYASKPLKIAASFIVFVFLIPYTASLYNGLSGLFHAAFDIPYAVVVIVMAALTGVYVIFGGYMATAINDFIQGIIMLVGIVAVIAAVLNANGGAGEAIFKLSQIPSTYPETLGQQGAFTSFFGTQPLYLLVVVLLTSLGTWGLPQMVGKFYSIKNEDAIKKGTVISTLFAIVVAGGCYFLGGFGRLYTTNPAIYKDGILGGVVLNDRIVPAMLASLPAIIIALVIVLVLSASMSTLSSLALTSSSTLALDVILPAVNKKREKKVNETKSVLIMRLLIVFFIALSAVIAILKDTVWADSVFIAQMMGISWGALAGAFLAPFLYGLYSKKISKPAVATCFVFGTGLEIVQLLISMKVFTVSGGFFGFIFKNSLYSGVFAMLAGLVLVPLVSAFTQKWVPQSTEETFSCFDCCVTTDITDSLG